jgi:hypothetical protein
MAEVIFSAGASACSSFLASFVEANIGYLQKGRFFASCTWAIGERLRVFRNPSRCGMWCFGIQCECPTGGETKCIGSQRAECAARLARWVCTCESLHVGLQVGKCTTAHIVYRGGHSVRRRSCSCLLRPIHFGLRNNRNAASNTGSAFLKSGCAAFTTSIPASIQS